MKRIFIAFMTVCIIGLASSLNCSAQKIKVHGNVSDEYGQPISGAVILEVGTVNGTTSDYEGNYKFEVSNQKGKLSCSFMGFTTQIKDKKTIVNFVLEEENKNVFKRIKDKIIDDPLGTAEKVINIGSHLKGK